VRRRVRGGAPSGPRRRALKNIGEKDDESKILVERKIKKNSKKTGIDLGPRISTRNQERQERRD
jgi:hypothetical protein